MLPRCQDVHQMAKRVNEIAVCKIFENNFRIRFMIAAWDKEISEDASYEVN